MKKTGKRIRWLMMSVWIGSSCGHAALPAGPITTTRVVPIRAPPPTALRSAPAPDHVKRRPRPLLLAVNVPAFRLDVYEGDSLLARYPITAGSPHYPTPLGVFRISEITWNPWWIPPASEWASAETVTPPGPRNPMGKVKMRLEADYYVHGTADSVNLGSAASHGCVRLANPDIVHIGRLIHTHGYPGVSAEQVNQFFSMRPDARSQRVVLPRPVPFVIRYERVELDGMRLFVYPDVYEIDSVSVRKQVIATLATVGLDSTSIDQLVWADLVAGTGPGVLAVPIEPTR